MTGRRSRCRSRCELFSLLLLCCLWRLAQGRVLRVQYKRGILIQHNAFWCEDEDLVSSVTLGRRCEEFIRSESKALGINGEEEAETKPLAVDICHQVAEQLQMDYDPEAYYKQKREVVKTSPELIVAFLQSGWVVIKDMIPKLRDETFTKSILETLKKRKFEYVSDAIYMAKKKWGLNKEEASEWCDDFDENVLIDDNLVDNESAENIYLAGVKYMKCVVRVYSVLYPEKFVYLPFNQVMNIHLINSEVYQLATSKPLGAMAAALLQHSSVRLYQTALFSKDESSINLQTEWHRDLNMIPLDTREGGSLTFWCPLLRNLSYENGDSMLRFVSGSHRDMSREYWYNENYSQSVIHTQAFSLQVGDCTVHHGWINHHAPQQSNSKSRLAIGLTYVIGDATVLRDLPASLDNRYKEFSDEDEYSYRGWMKDMKEGDVIDHPLLPLVFRDDDFAKNPEHVFTSPEFDEYSPPGRLG